MIEIKNIARGQFINKLFVAKRVSPQEASQIAGDIKAFLMRKGIICDVTTS